MPSLPLVAPGALLVAAPLLAQIPGVRKSSDPVVSGDQLIFHGCTLWPAE